MWKDIATLINNTMRVCMDDSVVKSSGSSSTGYRLNSHLPHSGSELSVFPVPEDLLSSSSSCGYQTHM